MFGLDLLPETMNDTPTSEPLPLDALIRETLEKLRNEYNDDIGALMADLRRLHRPLPKAAASEPALHPGDRQPIGIVRGQHGGYDA